MSEQAAGAPQVKINPLRALVPLAPVADVAKSIEFYKLLGFEVKNIVESDGHLQWAWLQNGDASFMIGRSARPMNPDAQDVLFYLYVPDMVAYRNLLLGRSFMVGEICYPFYSPRGEFRIDDPDGYALFVAHAE